MVPVLKDILRIAPRGAADWLLTTAKAHELLHITLCNLRLLETHHSPAPSFCAERDRLRIASARAILVQEFIAPPRVDALARRVGLNTSRLCAGFKQQFSETMSTFVRRQRMELAQSLLRNTHFQVREVARRVGYGHHATFTAAFVRHFGVAPKIVRR
jgi:AraC family transcriptional activator of pyochelin receptor